MFILGLALLAAAVLSMFAFGLVVPIWALVDCATSKSNTARKVIWIVAMFITGGFASIVYALVCRNSALKRTTVVSILAFPTLIVILVFTGMTKSGSFGKFSKSPLALAMAAKAGNKSIAHTITHASTPATTKPQAATAANPAAATVMQAGAPAAAPAPAKPTEVNRLTDAADAFRSQHKWPAAIAAYDSLLKMTPNAPGILLARGDVKASACDSTGADHDFRAAIGGAIQRMNADSLDPEAIYWQGVGLGRLGDYRNAHVMVRVAIRLDSLRGGTRVTNYSREMRTLTADSAAARKPQTGCRGNPQA